MLPYSPLSSLVNTVLLLLPGYFSQSLNTSSTTALLTSFSRANCAKADDSSDACENIPRFALRFQFHVLILEAPTNEVPEEDEEPVVPAGTRAHNAPSVLPGEWESTTVAMFVTSSYGHILH